MAEDNRTSESTRTSLQADALAGDGTMQYTVHQFLVDFLGSLLPGLLFLTALLFAVVPTVQASICILSDRYQLQPLGEYVETFLKATQNTPNVLWIAVFLFYSALGYVIGTHFQRQDPKTPDRESFALVAYDVNTWRRIKALFLALRHFPFFDFWDAVRCLVFLRCANAKLVQEEPCKDREERRKQEFGCTSIDDCQFPYPYIGTYLRARDHRHLAEMIPWQKGGEKRSKTFINRIKIRLQYYRSNAYRKIIKNEADVRLSTSMWYAAEALVFVSVACIALASVALIKSMSKDGEHYPVYIVSVLCPLSVLLFAWFSLHTTQRFVHYQRLREIFYVLETAYTAFRNDPGLLNVVDKEESSSGKKHPK